jgi:hypothetical protein
MNPNDIVAQQQALLNQYMQHAQQMAYGAIAIEIALLLLGAWVIYMFHERLREIGDEIRKFRISYESANPPQERPRPRKGHQSQSAPAATSNPFAGETK